MSGTPAIGAGVAGNLYDKQATRNPIARRLIDRFDAIVDLMLESTGAREVLDVGCGEGVPASRWARRAGVTRVVGLDVEDRRLRDEWARRAGPGLEFVSGDAVALPFDDASFDIVTAIESLEHLGDPGGALAEMTRCSRGHLLVTVPREPLWRLLNIARGAHLGEIGNTPGHLQHFSSKSLRRLLERHGTVLALTTSTPWLCALVKTR